LCSSFFLLFSLRARAPRSTLFPYTTLFRSEEGLAVGIEHSAVEFGDRHRMVSPVFQLHALAGEGDQNGSTEPLARFFRHRRDSGRWNGQSKHNTTKHPR